MIVLEAVSAKACPQTSHTNNSEGGPLLLSKILSSIALTLRSVSVTVQLGSASLVQLLTQRKPWEVAMLDPLKPIMSFSSNISRCTSSISGTIGSGSYVEGLHFS